MTGKKWLRAFLFGSLPLKLQGQDVPNTQSSDPVWELLLLASIAEVTLETRRL